MKLFRTSCAAFAALAIGVVTLGVPAIAAAATPEEIAIAYSDWQGKLSVLNDVVNAYDAAVIEYNNEYFACGSQPTGDDILACRRYWDDWMFDTSNQYEMDYGVAWFYEWEAHENYLALLNE